MAALPAADLDFPLRHPPAVAADRRADDATQRLVYDPGLARRAARRLARLLRGLSAPRPGR